MTNELTNALAVLPVFSARVLKTLLEALYAEPGYSDIEASDIATELNVSAKAVGGAISHLSDMDLVHSDEMDAGNRRIQLLYVPTTGALALHDDFGTKEKAIAFLETRINGPTPSERREKAIAAAKAVEAISEPMTVTIRFRPAVAELLQLDELSLYYGEFETQETKTALTVMASPRAAKAMLEDCRQRSTPEGGFDQPTAWYRVAKAATKAIEAALAEMTAPTKTKKTRKSADELDLEAEKLAYKRAQWRKWNKAYRARKAGAVKKTSARKGARRSAK